MRNATIWARTAQGLLNCPLRESAAVVALAALAALLPATGCRPAANAPPAAKPQQVMFVTPTEEVISDYEEFTGRTAAVKTVEIRARVSGYLDKVIFADGAEVKAGDELFQIDDRSFKAEAARAEANVSQYEARIERLNRQVQRATPLIENRVKSQEEYDQYTFDQAEAKATLQNMMASRDLAELNLSYTRVTTPIDGRISRRMVDPGNLVRADETVLTTVVAMDPIYAYFDIDERTVLRLRRLVREGRIKSTRESQVTVQVALADEDEFNLSGLIDFVDNQIDQTTGTLRLRAVISNPQRLLSPGLFLRIRFPVGQPHPALLIPEEALSSDQGQRFVYVIGPENKVAYRRVSVGMLQSGRRVITEGLTADERVCVSGLQRLRKDLEVDPRPVVKSEVAEASPTSTKPPQAAAAPTAPTETKRDAATEESADRPAEEQAGRAPPDSAGQARRLNAR